MVLPCKEGPVFPILPAMFLLVASAASGQCPGDLNGDNVVTVDEVVATVEHALQGCPVIPGPRLVDNGDGTVTDNATGLMWEKKVPGTGCLRCVGDDYEWRDAMSTWLSELNGWAEGRVEPSQEVRGLGGYNDWRLPDINELRALPRLTGGRCSPIPSQNSPCFDPAFGPTDNVYWSSTTHGDDPTEAWVWVVTDGGSGFQPKSIRGFGVRAVRRINAP